MLRGGPATGRAAREELSGARTQTLGIGCRTGYSRAL